MTLSLIILGLLLAFLFVFNAVGFLMGLTGKGSTLTTFRSYTAIMWFHLVMMFVVVPTIGVLLM